MKSSKILAFTRMKRSLVFTRRQVGAHLYFWSYTLIRNDITMIESVQSYLEKCFSMKDLGDAAYILSIKIYRDRSRRLIGLSQSTYIDKVLKRFNIQDSKK